MKYVVGLILFLFSIVVSAQPLTIVDPAITQTQCSDIDGEPVSILIDYDEGLISDKYAAALIFNSKPTIIINISTINTIPPDHHAIMFIVFHECGHHNLGHLKKYPKDTTSPLLFPKLEHDADCYAVSQFTKMYGKEVFLQALIDLQVIHTPARESLILSCER